MSEQNEVSVCEESVSVSEVYDGPTEPIVATPESYIEETPSAEPVNLDLAPANGDGEEEAMNHEPTPPQIQLQVDSDLAPANGGEEEPENRKPTPPQTQLQMELQLEEVSEVCFASATCSF